MILDSWFISIMVYTTLLLTYNTATFYWSASDKKIRVIDTEKLNNAQIKKIAGLYILVTSCCSVWLIMAYAIFNFGRSAKKDTNIKLSKEVRKILSHIAFKRSPVGFTTIVILLLLFALIRKFFLVAMVATNILIISAPVHANTTVTQIMEQKIKIGVYRTFNHCKYKFKDSLFK